MVQPFACVLTCVSMCRLVGQHLLPYGLVNLDTMFCSEVAQPVLLKLVLIVGRYLCAHVGIAS